MKPLIILILGLLILATGLLFSLQGAGIVHWPRESFMLDDHNWILNGIVVMLIGVALILTAWRIRQ